MAQRGPAPVLLFLTSAAAAWCAARVARRFVGSPQTSAWPDRARLVFPVRRAVALSTILALAMSGVANADWHGPLSRVPGAVSLFLGFLCALAGVRVATHRLARELDYPQRSLLAWSKEVALWILVFGGNWLVAGAAAFTTSDALDDRTIAVLAVATLAFLFFGAGGGLALARAVGLAKRPSVRLVAIVSAAAERLPVKPRAIYELDLTMANALAFPIGRYLAFTTRALEVLDDAELTALRRSACTSSGI